MKYLVVSDNHGDRDVLVDIADFWQDKVDGMFHCGDSELDVHDALWEKYVVVKGNCDYNDNYQNTVIIQTGFDRIFMTHGHLYNVNMGLNTLSLAARENKATIALYGHTHKLAAEKDHGILFVNSGSISQPRGQYSHLKTYAIIDTSETEIKLSYYDRSHQEIKELSASFQR